MKANALLITCLLTLLISCQERKEQEAIPTQSLKHELLMGDEYFIKQIADMILMNDSIIVLRSSKSEKLFQVLNPSRKRLVQAISKGDMIYFYNITGNGELNLLSEQVNSYPKYRYDNGAMHQESPIHYLDVCITEDYVYALYSGRNYKDDKDKAFQGNLIRVFDWNGKLVKELYLDIDVQAITTTKNNQRIYAVSYLPDPVLVAFEKWLPDENHEKNHRWKSGRNMMRIGMKSNIKKTVATFCPKRIESLSLCHKNIKHTL